MRVVAIVLGLAAGLAACGNPYDPYPPYGPFPDGGFGPPGSGPGYGSPCKTAADYTGDQVCARDGECLEPADTHSVLVHWTINGAAPTSESCAPLGELALQFTQSVTGAGIGWAPLMCTEGQFFIDVFPIRYDQVTVETTQTTPAYAGTASLPGGTDDVTCDMEPQ